MLQGNRWFRVGLLLAVLLTYTAVRFHAAEVLPTGISDDTFWNMIVEMSEPDGAFRYDNFLSNELSYQHVIPRLLQTVHSGGVYLGVAPEQNFTYIAALKPQMAFIVDIRRQNMLEMLMYKALFELSETRADFVSMLFARRRPAGLTVDSTATELFDAYERVPADPALFRENLLAMRVLLEQHHRFGLRPSDLQGVSSLESIYTVFVNAGPALDYMNGGGPNPTFAELMKADDGDGVNRSFLSTEDNYRYIRDLQRRNLIVPLVGDFAGPKTIRAIGQYLNDRNASVTAFYLSNVEQYLFNDFRAENFYENVATLPVNPGSTFIRSFSGGGIGGDFRFLSTLSPMGGFIEAYRIGRVRQYGDVRDLSQ